MKVAAILDKHINADDPLHEVGMELKSLFSPEKQFGQLNADMQAVVINTIISNAALKTQNTVTQTQRRLTWSGWIILGCTIVQSIIAIFTHL